MKPRQPKNKSSRCKGCADTTRVIASDSRESVKPDVVECGEGDSFMHDIPGIKRSFDIEDKGDAWHLHCKLCKIGWALHKTKNTAPGNILALLNHARGCAKRSAANKKNSGTLNSFFGGS